MRVYLRREARASIAVEESFILIRTADDRVFLVLRSASRAGFGIWRLGETVVRLAQVIYQWRYGRTLRRSAMSCYAMRRTCALRSDLHGPTAGRM
ncbi:DUF1990 family protein [Brevibacterium sp. VCM10]|uniref:DUF1990 family protein n=1 Tax=Brevibacterium sp. VCM10 TaxID=1381751 RepID=UPI00046F309C|nr:DUF1990 family protein [Brevibacterium sp. VCM10]